MSEHWHVGERSFESNRRRHICCPTTNWVVLQSSTWSTPDQRSEWKLCKLQQVWQDPLFSVAINLKYCHNSINLQPAKAKRNPAKCSGQCSIKWCGFTRDQFSKLPSPREPSHSRIRVPSSSIGDTFKQFQQPAARSALDALKSSAYQWQ